MLHNISVVFNGWSYIYGRDCAWSNSDGRRRIEFLEDSSIDEKFNENVTQNVFCDDQTLLKCCSNRFLCFLFGDFIF